MNRRARIVWFSAGVVILVGLFILSVVMPSQPEKGLLPSPAQSPTSSLSPAPSPTTTEFIGPTLGYELVPVGDAERRDRTIVNGDPNGPRCVSYLGETYYVRVPKLDHLGAHSKLDIGGHILVVTRMRDGSVQVSFQGVTKGFIVGEEFAFPPQAPADKFWINPESFGPITASKIGVCVERESS